MSAIGVDTGGTFSDLVYLREDGGFEVSKRPSTPGDFAEGIFDVLESVATPEILAGIDHFYHGTTVTTNAMITGAGARVGFITTAGHRDMLPMMRIIGRSAGQSESELKQYSYTDKPKPIVPKQLIREVHERVGYKGREVVALNEDSTRQAVQELVDEGVEAIAVCLLWSFLNPSHEQRVREIVEEIAPGMHVSLSSDIAPAIHEYERSATTVVNAHLAPVLTDYLVDLERGLSERKLSSPLYVMQSLGGVMQTSDAERRSVNTLGSGPAGGVVASRFLGDMLGHKNIICADVGGTSFDVGLVVDGDPVVTTDVDDQPVQPARPDDRHRRRSAPAAARSPGSSLGAPAGRPAERRRRPRPGLLRPRRHAADGDRRRCRARLHRPGLLPRRRASQLDASRASEAIREHDRRAARHVGRRGRGRHREIANHHMADLIRKMTIERGYDPRDFVLYAFGGAGPLHGAAFGREARREGDRRSRSADGLGLLGARARRVRPHDGHAGLGPRARSVRPRARQPALRRARARGAATARRPSRGRSEAHLASSGSLELRYKGQVHQVDDPRAERSVSDRAVIEQVIADFERRYESAVRARHRHSAKPAIELLTYRVLASTSRPGCADPRAATAAADVELRPIGPRRSTGASSATTPRPHLRRGLRPGMPFDGPAVIRLEHDHGARPPGPARRASTSYGNIRVIDAERGALMAKTVLQIPGSERFHYERQAPGAPRSQPEAEARRARRRSSRSTRSRSRSSRTSSGRSTTSRARR